MSTNPPGAEEPFGEAEVDADRGQPEVLGHTAEVPEAPERADAAEPAGEQLAGEQLRGAIEAILLIVDEPVGSTMIASVLAVPEVQVLATLDDLRQDYDDSARGFELREIAGGWRLYTRGEFAAYVERFLLDGQQARLTQAALETLAVVAYRQPVSRARVSAVRGVNVDGVMRTLVSRGLVEEAGAEESGAVLYQTTSYFLERLGLQSLEDLPNLANFLPETTTIEELEGELSSSGRDE
ncbi:MAG TPA: SMC-Scp complex subunit ScpB [Acidothermaceae bacterium]|jgi:segregation and condensation protein B